MEAAFYMSDSYDISFFTISVKISHADIYVILELYTLTYLIFNAIIFSEFAPSSCLLISCKYSPSSWILFIDFTTYSCLLHPPRLLILQHLHPNLRLFHPPRLSDM